MILFNAEYVYFKQTKENNHGLYVHVGFYLLKMVIYRHISHIFVDNNLLIQSWIKIRHIKYGLRGLLLALGLILSYYILRDKLRYCQ
jgi:hypothetical protein